MALKDVSVVLDDAISAISVAGSAKKLQEFRLSDQQVEHFHKFG